MMQRLNDKIEESFKIAEKYYSREFTRPKNIVIKTTGSILGHCCYSRSELMFNMGYYKQQPDEFLRVTVPHEVAHWIDREFYGYQSSGQRTIHHGRTWKNIMTRVYKLPPDVCAIVDDGKGYAQVRTNNVQSFNYSCMCAGKIHEVSLRKHNIICSKSNSYICRSCRRVLTLKKEDINDVMNKISQLKKQLELLQNS